ncbi:hypothetical protein [Lapillicoccus jejuensis]|uniref:Glycosyl hydrolase family 79 n=1 Tax=Lapillicoccus jejuensis TaxID=402171 RepID=A0A542E1Y3_9MICO|nr:hypothetical protein [Lapillicoccus jejuensis]TQJ09234.1 hypothetical protein FB458_2344 [Lapillicoccus jejuensis]
MTARPLLPPALRSASRPRLAALVALVLTTGALAGVASARSAAPADLLVVRPPTVAALTAPAELTVTVGATPTDGVVPSGAIGLSFDENVLGSRGLSAAAGLVPLMRRLGPSILRIGGTSSQWGRAVPFTATQLHSLDTVLRGSGWRAILTEDDAHWSASVTAQDARAANAVLGPRLAGMACGNEPAGYAPSGWRPRGWTTAQTVADELTCLRAVHAAVPSIRLVGPDAGQGDWVRRWAPQGASSVAIVTTHLYPMAACRVPWPLPGTLLGPAAQRVALEDVAPALAAARAAHRPLLLDETNSAACGGIRGLSDAYAAALWAPDDVLTLLQAGVVGLDFHGAPNAHGCSQYSPICLPAGASTDRAQPVYDGLLLAHDLGTGRLLPVSGTTALLRAHALLRGDGRTAVLLDNESDHPVLVHLVVPHSSGSAAETLMTDPGGLRARGGVCFTTGQVDGTAEGTGTTSYVVRLPAFSADDVVTAVSVAA